MSEIIIPGDAREKIVLSLQNELLKEYDCSLGRLEVDNLLDFVIARIGANVHNSAIDLAINVLYSCNGYIEEQLDLQKIYE